MSAELAIISPKYREFQIASSNLETYLSINNDIFVCDFTPAQAYTISARSVFADMVQFIAPDERGM